MLLGATVALGWLFDLPLLRTILPGWGSMKLNAAISFMLAGLALHTGIETTHTVRRLALVRACTLGCLTLAIATLLEYVFELDLGIDQWLIADPSDAQLTSAPGRMAANTALCFALLSTSLLNLDARHPSARGVARACAIASFSLAFVAVVGYAYDVRSLYGMSGYGTMAIHTALGLLVLCAGVLAARPQSGVRAQARGRPLFTAFVRDISERQRLARERDLASDALQTSEKRFRALVDASAQIVWSATADGAIVEDSPSWRAFTGQTPEEWRNHRHEVLHPEDIEATRKGWAEARSKNQVVELEFRIRRHDGEWRWMAMRGVPVSNPDGSIREWVGMNIDISDRRAAEETRRLAERMRERGRFFELSLDLVCIVSAQGQLLELNPSFTHTLGYTLEELLQQPFSSLVHPDDQEATAREMRKLAQGEPKAAFTNRYRCKDGSYRTLQWRAAPDEAGLIYATARDSTEEQRKAAALAESEERAQILIEGARDYAIIMLDPSGHITTWNAGAERIQGYRPSEIIGRHFSIFYTSLDLARQHPDNELALAREHGRYEEESWRVRKDGTCFWANVVISALRDRDGQLRGYAKVTRDFTERQRARAELEAREASLATSLKERELLLQEVHHRVKNNLQVIASLISMQIRKLGDRASRDALDECRARVQAIALIHEQLYRSHDFSSVPFSAYARSLAANIFQAAGLSPASIKLQMKVESVVLPVDKAIPCGLILNELLTNALKHAFPSDRQGSVSVELLPTTQGGISLVVADDGVGIAEDFSIEKSRSLGMQLVRTLVEQLGGEISIMRENGTAFGITFPADADAA